MNRKAGIPSLLSVEELAEYLGLKKQTIYNWLNQGKISGIKIGKVWRFDKADIERWLRECKRQK
jgi:excisionase family DNA binding protein